MRDMERILINEFRLQCWMCTPRIIITVRVYYRHKYQTHFCNIGIPTGSDRHTPRDIFYAKEQMGRETIDRDFLYMFIGHL